MTENPSFGFSRGRTEASRPGVASILESFLSLKKDHLTKQEIAEVLADSASFYKFPSEVELVVDSKYPTMAAPGPAPSSEAGEESNKIRASVEYAFEPQLQAEMENLFRDYKPDYGAFVAVDAKSGQILSMVSYSKADRAHRLGNLALRATFPSASVFKVVTAAAVIEKNDYSADTIIPFNGANHTLYRSNVMKDRVTRWTRYMTLKKAFASSVNTVFGKIGAFAVEPDDLRLYADRFGFNRKIASDIPVQEGRAPIPDDPWGRAEAASGFTRDNKMSPLQGALIAAAIVNDGVMMEPYIVQSVRAPGGEMIYSAMPKAMTQAVSAETAAEMRELMRATVKSGTSRGSFRRFFRKQFADLQVGGKTGSLTGLDPRGKYDWFVGYADDGVRKIAYASLTVHQKFWTVKSAYLARRAIEAYYKGIAKRQVASSKLE